MKPVIHLYDEEFAKLHKCQQPKRFTMLIFTFLLILTIISVFFAIFVTLGTKQFPARYFTYGFDIIYVPLFIYFLAIPTIFFVLWMQKRFNTGNTAFVEYNNGLYIIKLGYQKKSQSLVTKEELEQAYMTVLEKYLSGYYDSITYTRSNWQYHLVHKCPHELEQWYDRGQQITPFSALNAKILRKTDRYNLVEIDTLTGKRRHQKYMNTVPGLSKLLETYAGQTQETPNVPIHHNITLVAVLVVLLGLSVFSALFSAAGAVHKEYAFQKYENVAYTEYVSSDMIDTVVSHVSDRNQNYTIEKVYDIQSTFSGNILVTMIIELEDGTRVEIVFSNYNWNLMIDGYFTNGWNYLYSIL